MELFESVDRSVAEALNTPKRGITDTTSSTVVNTELEDPVAKRPRV
jgi:hypothetical protein